MKTILLLALTVPAFGVTWYGPVISDANNKPCITTAVTSTTPIKITVGNISLCGIVANSKFWPGFHINTGSTNNRSPLNLHLVDASDAVGECRTAKSVGTGGNSANQFDVYACDGTTPVAYNESGPGSSTWSHGGVVARLAAYTVRPHPILFADGDGTGGTGGNVITAGLQSAAAGGWYNASRPWRVAMDSIVSGQSSLPFTAFGYDHPSYGGIAFYQALKYWGDKTTNATNGTNAINAINNSLPLVTAGCDTTLIDCGGVSNSDINDYSHETQPQNHFQAYSLMRAGMSAPQRAKFADNILDGVPWHKGGYNYTGVTRTVPPYRTMTGGCTVTTNGTTTVTGSGCSWLSQLTGGVDMLFVGSTQSGFWWPIDTVDGNNQITLPYAIRGDYANVTNTTGYRFAPRWVQGTHVGWVDFGFNNNYNVSCHADLINGPLTCPDLFTQSGGAFDPQQNHVLQRPMRLMEAGLVLAEDDPRGRILATENAMIYYHFVRPVNQRYGGYTESSSGYTAERIWRDITEFPMVLKNSLVGDPDFTNGDTSLLKAACNWVLATLSPTSFSPDWNNAFGQAGEAGFARSGGQIFWAAFNAGSFMPTLLEAQRVAHYFRNTWPQGASGSYLSGHGGAIPFYMIDRPDVTPSAPITTIDLASFGTQISSTSPSISYVDEPRFGIASVNTYAFNDATTAKYVCDWSSSIGRDHAAYTWPHCDLHFGPASGPPMLSGDNGVWPFYSGDNDKRTVATMLVGGESNLTTGRVLFNRKSISNTLAMLSADVKRMYTTQPTTAYMTATQLKGNGDANGIWIRRYEMTSGSSVQMAFRNLYAVVGTPNANTILTVTAGSPSTVVLAGVGAGPKYYANVYGCTPTTSDGNLAHGNFTGASGNFSRFEFQASSGTSATCWEVIKYGYSAAVLPTIVRSTSGSHEVFDYRDATYPKVHFSAPAGTNNLASCSATTGYSGTGQAVCEGLAPGTYSFKVGGTPVSGCAEVPVIAGENIANCASGVPAGALVIQAAVNGSAAMGGTIRMGGSAGLKK